MVKNDNNTIFTAFVLSCLLHFAIFFYVIYKPKEISSFGAYGGDMGDFESVMLVSNLPLGELKEVAIDSVKAEKNYEKTEKKIENKIEKKTEKKIEKKVKEIKAIENIKSEVEISQKEEEKRVKHQKKEPEIKKENNQNKPISQVSGETNSVQKDNFASAPISQNGSKVSSPSKGDGRSKTISWQGKVMAHLNKFKKYPSSSLTNKEEGRIVVRVMIDQDGNVLSSSIKQGCKFFRLNDEALKLFKVASPLPKPPEEIASSEIAFSIPIEYDIKKYMENR